MGCRDVQVQMLHPFLEEGEATRKSHKAQRPQQEERRLFSRVDCEVCGGRDGEEVTGVQGALGATTDWSGLFGDATP